ncbi:MAG: efflux RND transporter permease subunit, partial [Bacteroidota bacterium]|nr:efflux RND transporter permease subunit [Bacteroidota bacterium]
VDRDAARRFGLSTAQIGSNLRTALFGKDVGKFKDGEDDYQVTLRFNDEYRYDREALLDQTITFRDQSDGKVKSIPIRSVVKELTFSSTYGSVRRKDQKRQITLYSNVLDGYNANNIMQEIEATLENELETPNGYLVDFTGEQQEQEESMEFLSTALLIAVVSIFLIIVAQFNSIAAPIIIMLSVLFSLIGVFLGLAITGEDFSVMMTMIGIISLAGIVVNNAIVLIDYTNLLRNRKKRDLDLEKTDRLSDRDIKQAIIEAGRTRLRPVLLTAITTILGLIPLAIGFNINFYTLLSDINPQIYLGGDNVDFWGPMSRAVIYGLVFATFLTLVVVPTMVLLFDRLGARLQRLTK